MAIRLAHRHGGFAALPHSLESPLALGRGPGDQTARRPTFDRWSGKRQTPFQFSICIFCQD